MGKNLGDLFLRLLGHFYNKFMEILGLRAPGNHSASIWFTNFSICLWENLKTLISMISVWTCPDTPKIILPLAGDGPPHTNLEHGSIRRPGNHELHVIGRLFGRHIGVLGGGNPLHVIPGGYAGGLADSLSTSISESVYRNS